MVAGLCPAYLVCVGWHVACLLSMCVGWSGDGGPASQSGVRASDGEQWLARLVTSLRAGNVSGAWCSGGPRRWPGARREYSSAGRNCLHRDPPEVGLVKKLTGSLK